MQLSISNIAWSAERDDQVYMLMKKYGFSGLEIAPTRVFPKAPYDKWKEAKVWAGNLKREHNFMVSSMQSIWFGCQEKLFGTAKERQILGDYTKKAIDFAVAIACKNLVFGCPGNRVIPEGADGQIGIAFFKEMGDYAASKGTVIALEANPPIYNTNYINDTMSALNLIEQVDSKGFLLNLDVGTMIQNEETVGELCGKVGLVNHVHISEPELKPIKKRRVHEQLKEILVSGNYHGFVSIEMGKNDDLQVIENTLKYVRGIFG